MNAGTGSPAPCTPGILEAIFAIHKMMCSVDTARNSVYDTHMKSSDLIHLLEADGWTLDRVRGSHHVFRHPTKAGIVVVPHPKKDLGKGLVSAICKQAGI